MSVLIVGGSGMLAKFTQTIANSNTDVVVICRNQNKFNKNFAEKNTSHIHGMFMDYRNTEQLCSHLTNYTDTYGKFDSVVSWCHSEVSEGVQQTIADYVVSRYFNIFGSAAANPHDQSILTEFWKSVEQSNPALHSHSIVLGFIVKKGIRTSRWLTNSEISDGVLQAFENKKAEHIVGQVEPWPLRP